MSYSTLLAFNESFFLEGNASSTLALNRVNRAGKATSRQSMANFTTEKTINYLRHRLIDRNVMKYILYIYIYTHIYKDIDIS